MIRDTFVIDGVAHYFNFAEFHGQVPGSANAEDVMELYKMSGRLMGGVVDMTKYAGEDPEPLPPELSGSADVWYDILINSSPTDMAMVGNTSYTRNDALPDPDRYVKEAWGIVQQHPERLIFGGGVDPTHRGLNYALEAMEWQVRELGAASMKFYPLNWRCDDEKLAYPLFEKARSLGINILQFHKNQPPSRAVNVEIQAPNDMQGPARDFPDMTFIMHHPMYRLYFDETVEIAARFPNFYLQLSPLIHQTILQPRMAQHAFGVLLQQVGSEKLLYGTEGPVTGNPTLFIESIMNFTIPDDLRQGYGYPQMTQQDKDNILGRNFARLFNIDIETKKQELATTDTTP